MSEHNVRANHEHGVLSDGAAAGGHWRLLCTDQFANGCDVLVRQ
jgi:hypothetical protein